MNFIKNLWREVEPIFNHGIIAALIGLIAAGLLKLFEVILPPQYADELRAIDHTIIIILFWLFGFYTVAILLIRLGKHLYHELKGVEIQQISNQAPVIASIPDTANPDEQSLINEITKEHVNIKKDK